MTQPIKVRVRAFPKNGFYRCGRYWPAAETEATIDEDQLEALCTEKNLAVQVLGPVEGKGSKKAAEKAAD